MSVFVGVILGVIVLVGVGVGVTEDGVTVGVLLFVGVLVRCIGFTEYSIHSPLFTQLPTKTAYPLQGIGDWFIAQKRLFTVSAEDTVILE